MRIRQILASVPFFRDLKAGQLEEVAKRFTLESYPKGTILFHENDPANTFYIVVSGELLVQRQHADGEMKTITKFKAADSFGEVALLANTGRSATVVANSDVEVLSLPKKDFHLMMEEYPAFGKYFNTLLSRRIQAMNQSLATALGTDAKKYQIKDIHQMNELLTTGAGKLNLPQMMDLIAEVNFKHDQELAMGKEPLEIFTGAMEVGGRRLYRSWIEMALSGLIAGINVAFGALAASTAAGLSEPFVGEPTSTLIGAIFFPIGFIFLALGRAELFTENFLLPVAAVLERKAPAILLLKLWGLTLTFNMIGAFFFSFLASRAGDAVLRPAASHHIDVVALGKVSHSFEATMIAAIFAGMLITTMTWLMLACDNWISKIAVIWMVGFLINLNGFNHIVVNSFEIFYSMFSIAQISIAEWITKYAIPTIIGNIIGGTLFVTMLVYIQAKAAEWRRRGESGE